ncbi:hypothetical protein Tco_0449352 [Tanacetum coccineum]
MLRFRNLNHDPPVDLYDLEGSDEGGIEIDSLTKEPLDTLLMGDEKEDFDINSPLGEQVVDFLIENEDVAGLPRHLVKRLFSHLVKNLSSTKRMSDEPLGDDSKPRSYDVTFSNSLFEFNDDYTLCYNNPLFDDEFEDISKILSDESKVHIEVLSVLWGNRPPIPDCSLPLSSRQLIHAGQLCDATWQHVIQGVHVSTRYKEFMEINFQSLAMIGTHNMALDPRFAFLTVAAFNELSKG